MCEKPQPPENFDVTEGKRVPVDFGRLYDAIKDSLSDDKKPSPPPNQTTTRGGGSPPPPPNQEVTKGGRK
ncbi:MAG: hypothetical protein NTZ12_07130 [Candidatus Aminicenantes bacterium]|nr:hypothetical protein [Candidatus Aminicenantes bacterium]